MLSMSCPRAGLMVLRYSRSCAPVCYRSQGAAARIEPTFLAWQAQHLMQANQANSLLGTVHARLAATKAEAPQSDTSPKAKKQGKVDLKPPTPPSPTPVTPAANGTVKTKPSGGSETESKKSKKRKSKALKPGEESQKRKKKKTTASASGASTGKTSGSATSSIPGTTGKAKKPNTSKSGGESQKKQKKKSKSSEPGARPPPPSGFDPERLVEMEKFFKRFEPGFVYQPNEDPFKEYRRLERDIEKHFKALKVPGGWSGVIYDQSKLKILKEFLPEFTYRFMRGSFPGFTYQSTEAPYAEFFQLKRNIRKRFNQALVAQFGSSYGEDVDSLNSWQRICWRLWIDPLPQTVRECRKLVMATHINLVDLTTSKKIKTFEKEKDLASYTRCTEKYFPKHEAKADGLLRYLLRHIDSPIPGKESKYYRP